MFERVSANVIPFGTNATSTKRTIFGSSTQSDDIDDNYNNDFKLGWEVLGLNDAPPKQWFNALGYTQGSLISYLYQQGLPKWNILQEFYEGSYTVGSDSLIYQSLSGTDGSPNIGNNPTTDTVNWQSLSSLLSSDLVDLISAQTIAGIKNFTDIPTINSKEIQVVLKNENFIGDVDTILEAGNYQVNPLGSSNLPTVEIGEFWALNVYGDDSGSLVQQFTRATSNDTYIRVYNGTSWSAYKKVALETTRAYTNVLGTNSVNVVYTNTANNEMEVLFTCTSGAFAYDFEVDGSVVAELNVASGGWLIPVNFTVPSGSTYEVVTVGGSATQWYELV